VQCDAQLAHGTEDRLLAGVGVDREYPGDVLERLPLVMAQDERGALGGAHACELLFGASANLVAECMPVRIGNIAFDRGKEILGVIADIGDRAIATAPAQLFECGIHRDAVQPRAQRRTSIEIGEMAPCLEEGLLHRVLGQRRIARDAHAHREQRARLRLDDASKCTVVTCAGPGDPFFPVVHATFDAAKASAVSHASCANSPAAAGAPIAWIIGAESTSRARSASVPRPIPAANPVRDVLNAIIELIERERLDEADAAATAARRRFPDEAEPARLHGIVLLRMGRSGEAVAVLEEGLGLAPQSIEVLCNLGSARLAHHDAPAALAAFEAALALAPAHPAVLNGIGNAHAALDDPLRARDAYAAATRTAPGYLGAWLNLAAAELALGHASECERLVRGILAQTRHPEAGLLLGQALSAQGRVEEAMQALDEGQSLAPGDARFAYQAGLLAEEDKRLGDAARAYAHAMALDPTLTAALAQRVFIQRQRCDWHDLEHLSLRLREAVAAGAPGITPFGFLAEPADAAEQLRCARTFATGFARSRTTFIHATHRADAPLRVGFVSNGFGNHPTGLLTVAMFEALASQGITIHLFATAATDGKAIVQRLRAAAHGWHELAGLAPREIASRIHAQDIEILVDLRVWGGGNVAAAFALRPAPIQVNWLAYPGTSGAPWLDYVIADRVVLPEAMRAHFSEKVAWLPRCFQPSDPTRTVGVPPSRAACGLPVTGVVYACFNNSYKLNPRSVERLLAVLRGVPGSVLWLLTGPDGADDALRMRAQQAGIDPVRLVFMAKLAHDEYLARYHHADLFLDCTPYNAHTTASDAIWAGCPVLTVPGDTFAGRVAASLNHHLGMHELNAVDDDAYVDFAVRVGRDQGVREKLRARLARSRASSGLFDMQAFAADFAGLLRMMAARHRNGLPPAAIDAPAAPR
jgi:predicted O-linked N-acetylglucosamine transferase (SPINDLY family)